MAQQFNWDDLPDAPSAQKVVTHPGSGVKTQGSSFNWDDLPDAPQAKPEATVGQKAESALQGFGQAGTFGYLPNLQAAAEPITDKIFGFFTGKDAGDNNKGYVERRDENVRADLAKQKQAPGYYGVGQVAGSLATPIPGSGLIKGAGVGAKLGRAALGGAISGAAYNPGEVEGQISGIQPVERFQQGLLGAGTGVAAQGVGMGLGKVANTWAGKAEGLQKAADTAGVVQAGVTKGQLEKIMSKKQVPKVAKFLRDEGLSGAGKTFDDIYHGSTQIMKQEGPKIGATYSRVQQKIENPKFLMSLDDAAREKLATTKLSATDMAAELGHQFQKELKGKAGGKAAISRINTELETLAELGSNPNIEDLYATRKSFDDLINYDKSVQDMPLAQQYLKKTRDHIQKKIEGRIEALDNVVGGDELKTLKEANRRYSGAAEVNKIAQKKVAGEETKSAIGLLDRQAALGGLGLGLAGNVATGDVTPEGLAKSAGMGLLTGAASKYGRRYGPGVMAGVLNTAAKASAKDPTGKMAGLLGKGLDKALANPMQTGSVIDRTRRGGGFLNE